MAALLQKRLNVVRLLQRKLTLVGGNRELKRLRRNEMMHGARDSEKGESDASTPAGNGLCCTYYLPLCRGLFLLQADVLCKKVAVFLHGLKKFVILTSFVYCCLQ